MKWIQAMFRLPSKKKLDIENNICIRVHGIDYQSSVFNGVFNIVIGGIFWPIVTDAKYIEWLDETPSEEPDQDKLWEELNEAIVQQIGWSGWSGPAIDRLKTQYTITRKL